MIQLKEISKRYGDTVVFDRFSMTVESGKIFAVVGNSGSGKTTLLNILCGLIEADGKVFSDETGFSYIFQNTTLVPSLTVKGNLDLVLKHKIPDRVTREKLIGEMLQSVELEALADRYPLTLSGGQAQRVSMARAFAYPASAILMDEPFKGLDLRLKAKLIASFHALWEKERRTVVFVTHEIEEALLLADRIVVLGGAPARIIGDFEPGVDRASRIAGDPRFSQLRAEIYDRFYRED